MKDIEEICERAVSLFLFGLSPPAPGPSPGKGGGEGMQRIIVVWGAAGRVTEICEKVLLEGLSIGLTSWRVSSGVPSTRTRKMGALSFRPRSRRTSLLEWRACLHQCGSGPRC